MSTNRYVRTTTATNEQDLHEALVIEATKMFGQDMKYLPRTNGNLDTILGDDYATSYDAAATIEMMVKSVDGFEGPKDLMSKFGLQIQDQIRFVVSKKRFEQIATEKLQTERGWNVLMEDGSQIRLEDATGDAYSITSTRPLEGDLVFFPLVGKLFEIKHVENETMFYQFGRLYTYELMCELYSISQETLATGDATIDSLDDLFNTNQLEFNVLLEDGFNLLTENDDFVVLDSMHLEDLDQTSNNDDFRRQSKDLLIYDETNAFGFS